MNQLRKQMANNKLGLGRKKTDAEKLAHSAKMKGRKFTKEHCDRRSLSRLIFTNSQILDIYKSYMNKELSQDKLAEKYLTSQKTIHRIVHRVGIYETIVNEGLS